MSLWVRIGSTEVVYDRERSHGAPDTTRVSLFLPFSHAGGFWNNAVRSEGTDVISFSRGRL